MKLLYLLESIRNPFLDKFFSMITYLGGETLFLAIAIIVFWCVSKRQGYYLMTVGFFGILLNQFLKLLCRVPRPWVRDPDFTIVESARAEADGYSFPSGHTQNVTAVLGCPARFSKSIALRIVFILLILLTAFSRMYLGVHTPADVGVSLIIGAVLVFGLYPFFSKNSDKPIYMYAVLAALTAGALAFVLFVDLNQWPAGIDGYNLSSGMKNGYLLLGCSAGMLLSYHVERKYISFDEKAPLWAQILKTVLGLAIILALKAGLKPIFSLIFGGHDSATALRYFLIVVFAACVWPLTFPWFARGCPLGRRAKKALQTILAIFIVLLLLAGILFRVVTRDTNAAPISTDNAENTLITPLGTTMLSGHRAGGGIAPENTMMALKNCVNSPDYELDFFEFDIHLTADGVPVLLHDSTLDRTSDAAEYFGEENVDVGEKTLAELKNLNMGEAFVNDAGEAPFAGLRGGDIPDDLRIVSLDEALAYLEASGDYRYIIEIKDGGDKGLEAADKLYATLESFGCTQRTVVGTFHNEVTAYLDSTYPDLPRSAGVSECIKFYVCSLLDLNVSDGTFPFVALQIPTTDYIINLGTSRVINYAHKNGIAVQYWTINDSKEMFRLQSIGADAIMTDVPDRAATVLVQP
ncbi:MAG: glycerophosphodiester phosphodiesterase family protein [Clostridiales bacterium]|nr:glycerophosphodiester phosphodiesterase family protein [Clostridiales bacterium]